MPSLGSATPLRRIAERLLRGAGIALLIVALWRLWASGDASGERVVRAFDEVPTPVERDRLAAAFRAGSQVRWRGELPGLAAMAERTREPGDRWRLSVVGGDGLLVSDALGTLDSLPPSGGTLRTRTPRNAWRISVPGATATVRPGVLQEPRRVAVFGAAGWEAKFLIAALEEEGWGVDARLTLGPSPVVQGDSRLRLDRHAAAVVLDSGAVDPATLVRFARAGGGVVLAGDAAAWNASALRASLPARSSDREEPETRELADDPLGALAVRSFRSLRDDATPIAVRDGDTVIVARRVAAGRLLQVGFYDTWRWRMQGEERALQEHRTWWSTLVAAAAAELPRASAEPDRALAAAPLAELVHALGPASDETVALTRQGPPLPRWLGAVILIALLGEWASRRARGAA